MNDIIIDIDNFENEIDNIILSKKISNDNISKYFIYLDRDNLNNLLIKIPPIRLLYNYSNSTFNQINFPLNPNYSKRLIFPESMISGFYKYIVFEEIEKSTGKVYDEPCHKIMKKDYDLPNTDWVAQNHWCVPIYYKGNE